uniref:SMC-Scp complex subunit ScpB n=1 Tax=Vaginimicrobium propionicum TaxID=1871034 RepID=UPI000970E12D|nr:SMC-Scp complex subunit ScpB [Vaginimicrobium propionicum]
MSDLAPKIEALLIVATEPVTRTAIAAATDSDPQEVGRVLRELADFYDETGRGFQLRNIAGGWQLATRQSQAEVVKRWVVEGQENKLTQASLETLAVIAYMQPVSRSRVSAVRGVNVDGVVRTLISRGLVEQIDSNEPNGASLVKTTDYFLERLGLASLADLPPIAPLLPQASELEAELASLHDDNEIGEDDE